MSGWVRADLVDRALTFVTNQAYLLHPYGVTVGGSPSRILCLIEMEPDFVDWVRDIDHHKVVEIHSIRNRRLAMRLEHLGRSRIRLRTRPSSSESRWPVFYPNSGPQSVILFQERTRHHVDRRRSHDG